MNGPTAFGRGQFLVESGGLAAATVAACAGGEQERSRYGPQSAGAATPTPSGHDAAAPRGADRPQPSGKLAAVYDAALPP